MASTFSDATEYDKISSSSLNKESTIWLFVEGREKNNLQGFLTTYLH